MTGTSPDTSAITLAANLAQPISLAVDLESKDYKIHIGPGLLDKSAEFLQPFLKNPRVFIITDDEVGPLYLPTLEQSLLRGGITPHVHMVPNGESSKSADVLFQTLGWLIETGMERGDLIVALGGGVVGDLAGFAAAIAMRGIDFIQIPTTLLAQVDSSVGGKTGINIPQGKNLVGSFHQPRCVLADTGVLSTLPRRELLAGYSEVVKYGLIDAPEFFSWLESNGKQVIEGDITARMHAIRLSCESKARIVSADEREMGNRALLNLGHTFAHGLEAQAGYDGRLLHGEAVSIGMVLAARLSTRLGFCSEYTIQRLSAHLKSLGLPTGAFDIKGVDWEADKILESMRHDKKNKGGKITLVLLKGIGKAFISRDVSEATISDFLHQTIRPS